MQEYYNSKSLIPPHQLYPFEEGNLKEYGKVSKPTVREALLWCANNFKVEEEVLPSDSFERFELAFKRESEADIGDYLENSDLIADAIYFGFESWKGQTLEGVIIEEITRDVKPKVQNKNFINFKIIGSENGKKVKIGLAVIQSSQFTLTAGLKRLNDYETFELTRGCLVRSQSKIEQMRKNSEAYKLLNELISEKGGENVDLIEEQIRPLIAILAVYQKRLAYKLTEEEIFDIIFKNKITVDNLLLKEILSNPSGNMPAVNEEEEDIKLIDNFLNSSNMSETEDSDDLSELFS